MIPKEKAISLVDSFISAGCLFANAKKCAVITVNEILMSNPTKEVGLTFFNDPDTVVNPDIEYWQQVKTEIEKL